MIVKPATDNIPSEGSSICGFEIFKMPGGSIPRRVAPNGPAIRPIPKRAKRMMLTKTKILVEHPQPIFIDTSLLSCFSFVLVLFARCRTGEACDKDHKKQAPFLQQNQQE